MGASIYSVGNLNGQLSSDQALHGSVGYVVKEIFLDTAFTFRGTVSWYADLEAITANDGDVYHVENGSNYVYSDGQWWEIGLTTMEEGLTEAQIEELQDMVV